MRAAQKVLHAGSEWFRKRREECSNSGRIAAASKARTLAIPVPPYRLRHRNKRNGSRRDWGGEMDSLEEEVDEFGLLGEKGVVAVGAGHFAVVGVNAGGLDDGCEGADRLGWEQPV